MITRLRSRVVFCEAISTRIRRRMMNPEPPFDDPEFLAKIVADLEKLRADVQELNQAVQERKRNDEVLAKLRGEVDATRKLKD